ncbi:MAG TPA: VOC family protein [Candidatus Limnocylindrales bacterium]|nr:VOC family protein [Candidatus Limnocylindrales bacterium]
MSASVRYMVSDVERSIAFYRDVLGFRLDQHMGAAFARMSHADLVLWLSGPTSSAARPMPDGRQPEPGGWNRFVIEVGDIDAVVAAARAAGASFRNEVITGPGGQQVVLDDPDGNPVEIFRARR